MPIITETCKGQRNFTIPMLSKIIDLPLISMALEDKLYHTNTPKTTMNLISQSYFYSCCGQGWTIVYLFGQVSTAKLFEASFQIQGSNWSLYLKFTLSITQK